MDRTRMTRTRRTEESSSLPHGRERSNRISNSQPTQSIKRVNQYYNVESSPEGSPPISKRGRNSAISLSQPASNSSRSNSNNVSRNSELSILCPDEEKLACRIIKYILAVEGGKQYILKSRIIKNVLEGHGKTFNRTMIKVKHLLSKIFGYNLVDIEGKKYMVVNEIKNTIPHITYSKKENSQLVLLCILLTHIFMSEDSCSEDLLFNFLNILGIVTKDNLHHEYFGNVKLLINEVFVAQGYLAKKTLDSNDSPKIEFKWGPRAEQEFSRRNALEIVSQMYNGRPLNSWPLRYKALMAHERLQQS